MTIIFKVITAVREKISGAFFGPFGFQDAASLSFDHIVMFHDYITIFLIFIFVLVSWCLLFSLCMRYTASILAPIMMGSLYRILYKRYYYETALEYHTGTVLTHKFDLDFYSNLVSEILGYYVETNGDVVLEDDEDFCLELLIELLECNDESLFFFTKFSIFLECAKEELEFMRCALTVELLLLTEYFENVDNAV